MVCSDVISLFLETLISGKYSPIEKKAAMPRVFSPISTLVKTLNAEEKESLGLVMSVPVAELEKLMSQ